MLRMALVVALLASSSGAYALDNNDLVQLNLRAARQQAQQQPDLEELLQPTHQARLRQEDAVQELVRQQQRRQFSQERYRQEVILEQQRQKDTRRIGEERLRDIMIQREQAPLFQ
ncbi:hypothetical protein F6V30_08110 [Oryzomonas sagensis]|uniref:Uncharacterized protein n=1 Tax=Oryzomonas sagensis TaxID=2603857 RepID=A0ABQ6TNB0_9BACT|nr:hypothetical protein [Oryzomonas sagensis]KAB0670118.1 hypothetical protein F6V30_08110 [Oryzomonas sagensis]